MNKELTTYIESAYGKSFQSIELVQEGWDNDVYKAIYSKQTNPVIKRLTKKASNNSLLISLRCSLLKNDRKTTPPCTARTSMKVKTKVATIAITILFSFINSGVSYAKEFSLPNEFVNSCLLYEAVEDLLRRPKVTLLDALQWIRGHSLTPQDCLEAIPRVEAAMERKVSGSRISYS